MSESGNAFPLEKNIPTHHRVKRVHRVGAPALDGADAPFDQDAAGPMRAHRRAPGLPFVDLPSQAPGEIPLERVGGFLDRLHGPLLGRCALDGPQAHRLSARRIPWSFVQRAKRLQDFIDGHRGL